MMNGGKTEMAESFNFLKEALFLIELINCLNKINISANFPGNWRTVSIAPKL